MPWTETEPMQQRLLFIADYTKGLYQMTELCQRYGISRKTGYKWVKRYQSEGPSGILDRSHAPKTCPHKTDESIERKVLELRAQHPLWGPKKLVARLKKLHPETKWPAPSTCGDILKRHGYTKKRRKQRKKHHPFEPPPTPQKPNDIWSVDFKGEFFTKNGELCYPLTITDNFSRYLLACEALPGTTHAGVVPIFKQVFREFGLPRVILSDNGVPFSSNAIHGLSRLNIWWLKLGILPLRIVPGHPQQNGKHERMHRTLKAHTAMPPSIDLKAQQVSFDEFRFEYNELRPHESLDFETPAEHYKSSETSYPKTLPEIIYPGHYLVRSVQKDGSVMFKTRKLFLSRTLHGESVGLEEIEDRVWSVYFDSLLLGRFDEEELYLHI